MRIIVAAVGRLKRGPEQRSRGALSRARRRSPDAGSACARSKSSRSPKAARATRSGACWKNRSRSPTSSPRAPRPCCSTRAARHSTPTLSPQRLRGWNDGGRDVAFVIGGAGRPGADALAIRPTCTSPSARSPGRTSWCASCCWSRSIARPRSCRGIRIIGIDAALTPLLASVSTRMDRFFARSGPIVPRSRMVNGSSMNIRPILAR